MIFKSLRSGQSVGNREIPAYISEKKDEHFLYLMAGVHGDEVEGVYVLKHLFEWIKTTNSLDYPIIVIPIVNVDGYAERTRINANGVDLNRNLATKDLSLIHI